MTTQVQMLDILLLLPPYPRKLLYTYPDLDMGMGMDGPSRLPLESAEFLQLLSSLDVSG